MLNFLSKNKLSLVCAVFCVCLVFLLCPLQAQAAGNLEVTLESPTNPDRIFTLEESYDLTVRLQGDAGNNETYYVSYRIMDSRKIAVVESLQPIEITLAEDGRGELLLDLSSVKGRDTFRAEITVADASGAIVAEVSQPFGRVAVDSVLSELGNVRNGVLFSTDSSLPNRYLYLKKSDRIDETLAVTYWITDTEGNILRQVKGMVNVTAKDYVAVPINLYGLEHYEQCRINYVVFDDSGNFRTKGYAYFHRNGAAYIEGSLYSATNQTGLIYANDAPYDLVLELWKTDHFAESFSIRYTVTDSFGKAVYEYTDTLDLPAQGIVQIPLKISEGTGYGAFTLTASTTDKHGNENSLSFQFSRVLSTAEPGDMPLANINDHFTNHNGDFDQKLELAAQAGFSLWRACIPWASVEKKPNTYTMPAAVEEVMTTSESLGMEPLLILAYGNDDLYGQPDPTNPKWLNAYVNYCKYIASYFGDRVNYYEVWNEWNHATMGKTDPNRRAGKYYAMVLAAASKAIKSVNPNATVIGGAMAGHNESWMVDMLSYDGNGDGKSDAMEAMDGFSFHTYATDWESQFFSFTEHNYAKDSQEVLSVLNRYGDASTKEIWLTETGWSTCVPVGVSEEEQAAYIVQMYAWALANPDLVDRIFWYDLMNDRDVQTLDWDPAAGEHNWGLIHSWTNTGDEPLPYSAKKSYVATCAMISVLAGATDGDVYELGEGIYAYRFQKDGKDLLVAWMDGESKTLTASFSGDMTITDMYGNPTTHTGTAQLDLSTCPIYIEYSKTANPSFG